MRLALMRAGRKGAVELLQGLRAERDPEKWSVFGRIMLD
jgi:hypothetical protein